MCIYAKVSFESAHHYFSSSRNAGAGGLTIAFSAGIPSNVRFPSRADECRRRVDALKMRRIVNTCGDTRDMINE